MTDTPPRPALPPEALRALAEAEERRRLAKEQALPPELGGRKSLYRLLPPHAVLMSSTCSL